MKCVVFPKYNSTSSLSTSCWCQSHICETKSGVVAEHCGRIRRGDLFIFLGEKRLLLYSIQNDENCDQLCICTWITLHGLYLVKFPVFYQITGHEEIITLYPLYSESPCSPQHGHDDVIIAVKLRHAMTVISSNCLVFAHKLDRPLTFDFNAKAFVLEWVCRD